MVATTDTFTATVADDGTIQLPAGLAEPGETVILHIQRPDVDMAKDAVDPAHQPEDDEPVRLTRLTAKTPEQKEEWRRQMNELIDRLAPMLKDMPDHADLLYGEDGLPK